MRRASSHITDVQPDRGSGIGGSLFAIALIGFGIYEIFGWAISNYLLIIRLIIWTMTIAVPPAVFVVTYHLTKRYVIWRTTSSTTVKQVPLVTALIGALTVGCGVILILLRLLLYLVDPQATVLHAKLKLVRTSSIVESLSQMQHARDEDVRGYSAKGWVDVINSSLHGEHALMQLLDDPSETVRVVTAREIARLVVPSREIVSRIVIMTIDKSRVVREQAMITLDAIAPDWHHLPITKTTIPKLAVLTYVDQDHELERAMNKMESRLVNEEEGSQTAQLLAPIIENIFFSNGKRLRAMKLAEKIGPSAGQLVPVLHTILLEDSQEIRLQAIKTLGALGAEAQSAVPELDRIATSGHEDALEALRVIDLIKAAIPAEAYPH